VEVKFGRIETRHTRPPLKSTTSAELVNLTPVDENLLKQAELRLTVEEGDS
jgi:hypothetical protein